MKREEIINKFVKAGIDTEHSQVIADCLVTADIYGVTSHGSRLTDVYVEKIKKGCFNLEHEIRILKESPSFCLMDGNNTIGIISGVYGMEYAIKKSKTNGIFTVISRNNNTFGPAFYYTMMAAKAGCIGIAFSNSPAQMAPIGGKDKLIGTNPLSIAVPMRNREPLILDMASSMVAKSKFKEYKEQGKLLPDGWATDSEGLPTNDPDKAMGGLVLPMAGFKGYGIAVMLDVLSGVLSGSAYLNKVHRFYTETPKCMNVGFQFIAIDPEIVMGHEFYDEMDEYAKIIMNSRHVEGKNISLPGDDRIAVKRKNLNEEI